MGLEKRQGLWLGQVMETLWKLLGNQETRVTYNDLRLL